MSKLKITIVTVCFNAADTIEETIKSVLNQTYENIEYIVIDGGSTDGTVDIIKQYSDKISYWVSEPDKGIYDAMNKGILRASGDYISFMNAGDLFFNEKVIENVSKAENFFNYDVIFGDSVVRDSMGSITFKYADPDPEKLFRHPTYRHGASFVKTSLHRNFLFDLSKSQSIGYALDYNCIYSLLKVGAKFKKINIIVLDYEKEGTSNNILKNREYNYKITHPDYNKKDLFIFKIKNEILTCIKTSNVGTHIYHFLTQVMNHIISFIPFWSLRKWYYKKMGIRISEKAKMTCSQRIISPRKLSIGQGSKIKNNCLIDATGTCKIGNDVQIAEKVTIMTSSYNAQDSIFKYKYLPIFIEDEVRIGVNATILQNVTIGKGAVVAAGAVVTKNVAPYTIVGGIPAEVIG